MTNLCRSLELKSGFDEQAGDRFWLFFRIPPTVGVREAKSAPFESETENVLQCVRFTTRSAEEKLHWTRSRIPTCCHTVDTLQQHSSLPDSQECDDQWEPNVSVWFLWKKKDVHFDSVSATSVTVKYLLNTYSFALSIYLYLYIFKRKSTKLYFLGEMFTSVEFVNLSTLQIGAVVFSLKHKRGAVIAKNVKLPPRLSYSLL